MTPVDDRVASMALRHSEGNHRSNLACPNLFPGDEGIDKMGKSCEPSAAGPAAHIQGGCSASPLSRPGGRRSPVPAAVCPARSR